MRVFISTSLACLICFNISLSQNRTIVINEFMYDPTPQVGLPDAEYIEIHNVTSNAISLAGWTLNEHPIPDYIIQPYDYLVLCEADKTNLFNTAMKVLGMESWDRLNNTGQPILLKDSTSNIIDSINYDGKWIKDQAKTNGGWSLELVKPEKTCFDIENWGVSISSTGGTPGFQNSIYNNAPDILKPYISKTECLDPFTIQLTFSETVNFSRSPPQDLFNVSPGEMLMSMDHRNFSMVQLLRFTDPIYPGTVYNLQVHNIADCEGNYISDTILQLGIGLDPHFNEILITELLVDEVPSYGLPESEYIEIFNRTNKLLNLKNMYIYADSKIYELPDYHLFPNTYYILIPESKAELFNDKINVIFMSRFPRLNNEGKLLSFLNKQNGLIFSIYYTRDWYKDQVKANGGYSLEMIDIKNPCGGIDNWTASNADIGGTPGRENSLNLDNPDLSNPEILSAHGFEEGEITIQFDEKLHPDCFDDLQVIVDNINMQNRWRYDTLMINKIFIETPYSVVEDQHYSVRISGIEDCVGNPRKNEDNPIIIRSPQKADRGDVVINEILFNPKPGGVDWIEIYNLSEKLLNLKNWHIMNERGQTAQTTYEVSGEHFVLEPFSYLVLTANADKVLADFPYANGTHILEMTGFPALPDKDGFISLRTPDDEKMDEFSYSEDQHNLFLKNREGVSLERVSPYAHSSEPASWQSASSDSGYGTPTKRNSQYLTNLGNDHDITISPLIFSPDQDGYEDYLDIRMKNPKAGYVANIQIFDIHGESIKHLVQSYLLGTGTLISWDGYTDKGEIARPGYYILLIEMFHPDGDYSVHKQKIVVGKKFY